MDDNKEKLLIQYLDCELSEEQDQEVLHMIAEDPEMRSMLRFELKIRESIPAWSGQARAEVPAGFRDKVMHAIEAEDKRETRTLNILEGLKSLWYPREIQLRPVYAICSVLLLITLAGFPYLYYSSDVQQQSAETTQLVQTTAGVEAGQVWTRFVYLDDEAESVAVAGDFSDWEPISLSKEMLNGEPVWTGLVAIPKGENKYMFVKNGSEWVTDPLATAYENDGFGNKNAVIYL